MRMSARLHRHVAKGCCAGIRVCVGLLQRCELLSGQLDLREHRAAGRMSLRPGLFGHTEKRVQTELGSAAGSVLSEPEGCGRSNPSQTLPSPKMDISNPFSVPSASTTASNSPPVPICLMVRSFRLCFYSFDNLSGFTCKCPAGWEDGNPEMPVSGYYP